MRTDNNLFKRGKDHRLRALGLDLALLNRARYSTLNRWLEYRGRKMRRHEADAKRDRGIRQEQVRLLAPVSKMCAIGQLRRGVAVFALLARRSFVATLLAALAGSSLAEAHITRIEITRIQSPTFEGASFGTVGQYEKLIGRAFGEVNPSDRRNAEIRDINLAARNARGLVEYSTDIYILRPIDRSKGNHRLFFEINNRGANLSFGQMNDATSGGNDPTASAHAGNGFLMRQGYTFVWSGWDATVPSGGGVFTMTVPVAKNLDGSSIVGPSLEEFIIDNSSTLMGALTYPASTLDKSQASMTVRVRYEDPPMPVPADKWEYVNAQLVRLLPAGTPFQRGTLYEFTYPAKDPIVAGLGFAGVRDLAAFLHRASTDDQSNPNPLADDVQFVYSYCMSQPCRMMHDLLWLGFNEDEDGRRVFDGMLNWVGGASGIFMNYRFAQPGRTHRQHIGRWFPEYQFPFANQVLLDPVTGKTDGRLGRCLPTDTCPKIFEVNSENEYWAKAMSIFHTDSLGNDLADPPNVRYYLMSSLPHSAGIGPTGPGICQQERNPLVANSVLRALLVDLDEWVTTGKEPPASRMPRRADGTLIAPLPQVGLGFPSIPGVLYNGRAHTGDLFDFGPLFEQGILNVLPPFLLGTRYPVLAPKTDIDGNDIAGIRLPDVAVPLATYTGWGLRAYPPSGDDGCDAAGQKIPFALTKAQRLAAGDPRLSIEERYSNRAAYVSAVTQAANRLQAERLLLAEDVQRFIEAATKNINFVPGVTGIAFSAAIVPAGSSFAATFLGTNLSDEAYFDIRFRRPDSSTDEVALNWQKGTSATHLLARETATGSWTVTGVRAHEDINDQGGPFAPVSAILTVPAVLF